MSRTAKAVALMALALAVCVFAQPGAETTYSWFVQQEQRETTVHLGRVSLELICNGEINPKTGCVEFFLENQSTMPVYGRIKIIPIWVDAEGNPTMKDTSDIAIASASKDFTLQQEPSPILVYGSDGLQELPQGVISGAVEIEAPKHPDARLKLAMIAEGVQAASFSGESPQEEEVW